MMEIFSFCNNLIDFEQIFDVQINDMFIFGSIFFICFEVSIILIASF